MAKMAPKSGQWMSKIVESLFFFKHFGLVKCLGCMDVLGPEEPGLARGVGVLKSPSLVFAFVASHADSHGGTAGLMPLSIDYPKFL